MLDRTAPPPSYEVEKFQLPLYDTHAIGNHAKIYSIADHSIPALQIEFVFESGKASQVVPGTSYYAIKMLAEGTHKQTANEISFGFESLGTFVEWGSGLDHTSIKIYCQSTYAMQTLDLLEEVLCQPSFPTDNFEILKKIRGQQIQQQEAKNSQFATARFNEMLFGPDHPLGNRLSTEMALRVDLSDVKEFYEKSLFNRPSVFITGDLSPEVIRRVDALIANLAVHDIETNPSPVHASYERITEERENSEQVSFRTGMFTLSKKDPLIHKLSIANSLLGGFFGSRLMQTVREELGYTYGIYSTFVHTRNQSYWMISSELIKKHVAHGEEAILEELRKLANRPPSDEELSKLKNYLQGKLLSSMDSIFSKGGIIKGLKLSDLPDTHYDNYFAAVNSITTDEISKITHEFLLAPAKSTLLFG